MILSEVLPEVQSLSRLDKIRLMQVLTAELERDEPAKPSRPGPGVCKGMITYMAPDFDAPLEDMKEYMQ